MSVSQNSRKSLYFIVTNSFTSNAECLHSTSLSGYYCLTTENKRSLLFVCASLSLAVCVCTCVCMCVC